MEQHGKITKHEWENFSKRIQRDEENLCYFWNFWPKFLLKNQFEFWKKGPKIKSLQFPGLGVMSSFAEVLGVGEGRLIS